MVTVVDQIVSELKAQGSNHRHLNNIDCLTACTACLVCYISTVNGHSKKKEKKAKNVVLVAGT